MAHTSKAIFFRWREFLSVDDAYILDYLLFYWRIVFFIILKVPFLTIMRWEWHGCRCIPAQLCVGRMYKWRDQHSGWTLRIWFLRSSTSPWIWSNCRDLTRVLGPQKIAEFQRNPWLFHENPGWWNNIPVGQIIYPYLSIFTHPIESMYDIFTYIWLIWMVIFGKCR